MEFHIIVRCGNHISIFVQNLNEDVGQILSVSRDDLTVRCQANLGRLSCRRQNVLSNDIAIQIPGHCLQLARLVIHHPLQVNVAVLRLLVRPSVACLKLEEILLSKALPIQEQLYAGCVRVGLHFNLSVCFDTVIVLPVPVGKQMHHRVLLHRSPLALVNVVSILRDTCGIHSAKV